MFEALVCDAVRTPFGRYGGVLAGVRTDDLAAVPITALRERHPRADWEALDDVLLGCANQAGEDNRNVARMAALLAGLPTQVPGVTLNRLCGSGLEAVGTAARAIRSGEARWLIAGGVESMSRAPFVMPKAESAFARQAVVYDTTLGWRFINAKLQALYGTDSMAETAENVAVEFNIGRAGQDAWALRSQSRALEAQQQGHLAREIVPVALPVRRGTTPQRVDQDEHPRPTTLESLQKLSPVVHAGGTVTAGNASGINDGAAAVLLSDETTAVRYGLQPRARVLGMAHAGVEPRVMGIGPAPATQRLLQRCGLRLDQIDVIEFNEAFAAQVLAVLQLLNISVEDPRVNAWGGAIALGHPLGASGARLVTTAVNRLHATGGRYALCSMCIGVGQGIALLLERL